MFECEICVEYKPKRQSFSIKGCTHSYCFDCIRNYVASRLEDGFSTINCPVPGCPGVIELEDCHSILAPVARETWKSLLQGDSTTPESSYSPVTSIHDILLRKLAKENQWQNCPKCKIFVDRVSGCRLVRCRCGVSFCHSCGTALDYTLVHTCPTSRKRDILYIFIVVYLILVLVVLARETFKFV
ncbi:hypothetical protein Ancab_027599 [Ancistrocladus abbreviatus]